MKPLSRIKAIQLIKPFKVDILPSMKPVPPRKKTTIDETPTADETIPDIKASTANETHTVKEISTVNETF